VSEPDQRAGAERVLARALGAAVRLESEPAALSVPVADAERASEAVGELFSAGIAVSSFALGQPSLDEVFLALTGHTAEADEPIEEPVL
jgi:ABC-2 type transport system ATP-binding protein